jgi:hypothetical protein
VSCAGQSDMIDPSRTFQVEILIAQFRRATRVPKTTVPPPYRSLGSMRATDNLIRGLITLPYADRIREEPVLQRKEPRQVDG